MRSRTKSSIPAALAGALTILATAWMGGALEARADTFVLKGGLLIEGAIVHATRNTVIVRRAIGGMHQMPMEDIQEVRLDLAQGRQVSGQMLGWADGVSEIRAGGEVIRVGEGRILSPVPDRAEPSRPAPLRPPVQPTVTTAAPRLEQTVRTAAAPALAQKISARRSVANGVAGRATARIAAAEQADSDGGRLAIKASVDPAETGGAGMVFNIELSRPAQQTIVLIYGTVDGTARAGQDYEPRQGVLTLSPGTRSAHVRVPLIDHERPRPEARFELFLTADAKVAEVVDQRIVATIPGDP